MREVMPELACWWESGATVGMGTVINIGGSSPREPGASMVVGPNGEVVGSVSGGCVEAAVYELSRETAASGTPALVRYGISSGDPYAPGLTCGGSLEIFASPVNTDTFPGLDSVDPLLRRRACSSSVPSITPQLSRGSAASWGIE